MMNARWMLKKISRFSFVLALLWSIFIFSHAGAETRIYPLKSINYLRFLDKKEFEEKFVGESLAGGSSPQTKGFFIRYSHESLTYYFGPEASKLTAEIYREELDAIWKEAVSKREHLNTARIEVVEAPFQTEPSKAQEESAKNQPPPPKQNNEKEKTESPSSPTTPSSPPQKSWWESLFGWMGF